MLTTTLNRIKSHRPCTEGWKKLLTALDKTAADDEPLSYETILKSNGLVDALWCCRAEPQYDQQWRLYAVWCARQVQHLMLDTRSVTALDVAERFANGDATREELTAAWRAAGAVTWDAAGAAARVAAGVAAWDAAWDAAGEAAAAARMAAAGAAAWAAAREAQKKEFLRVVRR